jgi:hypothetical protein
LGIYNKQIQYINLYLTLKLLNIDVYVVMQRHCTRMSMILIDLTVYGLDIMPVIIRL